VWWDLRDLGNLSEALLEWVGGWGPGWLVYVAAGLIGIVGVLLFLVPSQLAVIWIERRLIGRLQHRLGPNRVGPFGLLQPLADALKVLAKEAITPRPSDRWLFWLAPIAVFIPAITVYAVFPFGPHMVVADLNVALLLVVALGSTNALIVFMAGWSSNNKYSLLGAMRVVAMMVSYEVPLVLALLGAVLFVGSLSLQGFVLWQEGHWVLLLFRQPLSFLFFLLASLVELNRTPTDIAEAESEIVAGYHTEYSGFKFSLFYAAEYTNALAVAALTATVYLGGWWLYGLEAWVPGWFIFIAKVYLIFFLLVWLRGTLPRLRIDQLMAFGWKFLLPLSLVNVLLAGLEVLLWQELGLATALALAIFALVNYILAALLIVVAARLYLRPLGRRPPRVVLTKTVGHVLTGSS